MEISIQYRRFENPLEFILYFIYPDNFHHALTYYTTDTEQGYQYCINMNKLNHDTRIELG